MWQLNATNTLGEWETVDTYPSAVEAARKIVEMEGYPVSGVLFETMVEADPTIADSDEQQLSYLEHTGRITKRLYVVKQLRK